MISHGFTHALCLGHSKVLPTVGFVASYFFIQLRRARRLAAYAVDCLRNEDLSDNSQIKNSSYILDNPIRFRHSDFCRTLSQTFRETSFRRFRRINLVEACFLPARRFSLEPGPRVRRHERPYHGCRGRGEMLDALLRTQHNRLARKVRQQSTVTWPHHETKEDRDTQDRAGRPSAVATRRSAQTTRRPERPEDRAARRNELRRADRVSPEAPKHALQREAWQRRRIRPRERHCQSRRRPIGLARRAHRPAR